LSKEWGPPHSDEIVRPHIILETRRLIHATVLASARHAGFLGFHAAPRASQAQGVPQPPHPFAIHAPTFALQQCVNLLVTSARVFACQTPNSFDQRVFVGAPSFTVTKGRKTARNGLRLTLRKGTLPANASSGFMASTMGIGNVPLMPNIWACTRSCSPREEWTPACLSTVFGAYFITHGSYRLITITETHGYYLGNCQRLRRPFTTASARFYRFLIPCLQASKSHDLNQRSTLQIGYIFRFSLETHLEYRSR
jgi:hypothetical protein